MGASGTVVPGVAGTAVDGALGPRAFTATICTVYVVRFTRGLTPSALSVVMVIGLLDCAALTKLMPSVEYRYSVIGKPPLDAGGVNETVTDLSPATACTLVGESGTPTGVALTVADSFPPPCELRARTTTAYDVPLVSPEIVCAVSVLAHEVNCAPPSIEYS